MKRTAPLVLALSVGIAFWLALSASAQLLPKLSSVGTHTTPRATQTTASPTQQVGNSTGNTNRRLPRTQENFDIRADLQRSLDARPDPAGSNTRRLSTDAAPSAPQTSLPESQPESKLQREHPRTRIRWSSLTATPSRISNYEQALTAPSRDDAEIVARRFLKENNDLYRLSADEVEGLRVARRYQTAHNGVTHLTLEQRIGGIEVFHSKLAVHFDRAGAIITASGELLPAAERAANLTRPSLAATEALGLAAGYADTELTGPVNRTTEISGVEQRQDFDRAAGFGREASARLVYFPLTATNVRLAWEFVLWMKEMPDAYLMVVDAERGSLLYRYNLTVYDENPLKPHGLVYTGDSPRPDSPHTNDSPPTVERQDLPFRATPFNGATIFSVSDRHYDWWAGSPATGLISNNVNAYLDRDSTSNQPDLPRLATTDGNFSFPIDLTQAPTTDNNQKAAQVNLFYWVNRYHDILYAFGFTEAAGNFQVNNFGLGGRETDPVQAEAQDGSGTNNANFSTPPDGQPGRMQMYLWTGSPQLDGDLDQGVIIHELTHGLSNRLVGNGSGLGGQQSGGMGEGWSDYFGLALMRGPNDDVDGSYGVGQYVKNNYVRGIRRFPYSTSLTINPLTYGSISLSSEVHAVGEIWCNVLLEMRALLIKKYGFQEGQRQSLQLVVDGLKLTPASPSFLDARDAILLADRVNNGGANQCLMWQAFSKRGLGYAASTTDAGDTAPKESFDGPPYCNDTGSMKLDKRNYVVGETLRLTLGDRNAAAPVRVQVSSSTTGDQETITLTPDPVFAGSFSGILRLAAGRASAGDSALQASVEAGDQVIVTYNDASTSSGATAQAKATAGVVREKTVFEDHVEQGNQGWFGTGSWAMTTARSATSSHSWTDTPVGNYANLSDTWLISPPFDLTNLSDVALTIAHSFDLETGYDFGVVEYSTDDGVTWSRATAFSGVQASFVQSRIPLDGLANQARARIRFRLVSDQLEIGDGWYIDDIRLTARSANAAIIPANSTLAPVVSSLTPAFGPPAGGTRVTIIGANFTETEDTTVTFDGIPAVANVLGSTMMTVTTPAHAPGAVVINITNRNGAVAIMGGFTYYTSGSAASAPTLARIIPTSGSTRGGTVVTLVGANFTPETTAVFGSKSAAVAFVNANTLLATAPSATATGAVDVTVRNGTLSATLAGAFSYTEPTPPTVQILSPNGGETVFTNSTIVIRWKSSDNRAITKHRVALYRSLGPQLPAMQFVADITTDLSGDAQSFVWTVPVTAASNLSRIRVTAVDDEGTEGDAYSSTDFTITKRWEGMAAMPIALQRLAVASDGKYIYTLGGRTSPLDSGTTVVTVNRYDPAGNSWLIFSPPPGPPPLPTGLNGGEAVYLKGKIYLPGGTTATTSLSTSHFAFDVAANTWANVADVPAAGFLYALAADEARGVYYLTGGNNNVGGAVATVRAYNPTTNAWSDLPPMIAARYGHEAAMIDGKLYVAGGFGTTGGLVSAEVYDFTTNKWSSLPSLTRARRFATSAVGKDAAGNPLWFIAGGEAPNNAAPLSSTEVYDVRNNRWLALDNSFNLSTARTQLSSAVVGGMFYAIGGSTLANNSVSISSPANERLQIDGITPTGFDQPPALSVPVAQVAIANTELRFNVTGSDFGSPAPIILSADSIPSSASFTLVSASNNSVRGLFRWTPTASDAGKTFTLTFTVSDGQLSDTRSVTVRVVEASPLAAVNAANYQAGSLALDSIASAFGSNLAVRTEVAQTIPLPTELAGTTVTINGVLAPLFFVSATQINFAVPSTLEPGPATIVVSSPLGTYALGTIQIATDLPAIFTADASGTGDAAAIATADGVNYQTAPFDVMVNGQKNILIMYGTGLRRAAALNPNDGNGVAESVTMTIGGQPATVLYVGAQPNFTGLDQINVEIPVSLAGSGPRRVEVVLTLNGVQANRVTILIK